MSMDEVWEVDSFRQLNLRWSLLMARDRLAGAGCAGRRKKILEVISELVFGDSMLRTKREAPAEKIVKHSMARKSCSCSDIVIAQISKYSHDENNQLQDALWDFRIRFTSYHTLDDAYWDANVAF